MLNKIIRISSTILATLGVIGLLNNPLMEELTSLEYWITVGVLITLWITSMFLVWVLAED